MVYLYLFYICCTLPLLNIYNVSAKRKPLQRFLLEEGAKQPIFGSYNYDPIKQVFDVVPDENGTQSTFNGTYLYSTAYPEHEGMIQIAVNGTLTSQRYFIFRKNVAETTLKTSLRKTNVTTESKVVKNVGNKILATNEIDQQAKPNN